MSNLRLDTLSIENNLLTIQKGNVYITNTTPSSNLTSASLVLNGGLAINNFSNSISSTNGGALTIGGGLGIAQNLYVGGNQILESPLNIFNVNGNSISRFYVDSILNEMIYFSTDGIDKKLNIYTNYIEIPVTTDSINNTTGALIVHGGITILNTNTGIYNNGSTYLSGGLTVDGDIIFNNNFELQSNQFKLQHTTGQYTFLETNLTDFFIQNSYGNIHIDANNDIILNDNINVSKTLVTMSKNTTFTHTNANTSFYGGIDIYTTTNATSNTSGGALTISGGIAIQKDAYIGSTLYLNSDSPTKLNLSTDISIGTSAGSLVFNSNSVKFQTISFDSIGNIDLLNYRISNSTNNFTISSKNTGANSVIFSGDSTNPNYINILKTNSDYLRLGWNNTNYNISVIGTPYPIVLNNQINLETNGNIIFNQNNSNTNPNINVEFNSIVNSLSIIESDGTIGSFNIYGGTNIRKKLYVGDTLSVQNDISSNAFLNTVNGIKLQNLITISAETNGTFTEFNINGINNIRTHIFNNTTSSYYNNEFKLYSIGNPNQTDTEFLQISNLLTSGNILFSNKTGTGLTRFLQLKSNSSILHLETNGNIGINNTNPQYTFDINGTFNIQQILTATNSLITSSIPVTFTNTTASHNLTTGALIISGGLSIQNTTNAVSSTSGGALTIAGGLGVDKNVYINGTLSNTIAFINQLNILNTNSANSLTSGSLISSGGITIKTTENAQNVSNGGSLLTSGGGSIGKDLYVGNSIYNYNQVYLYGSTSSLLNIHDNLNVKRFSIGGYDDFVISRYSSSGVFIENSLSISNTTGQITINNSTISSNFTTGSLILKGGLTIQTTSDASGLSNGGGLSIYGGLSVNKSAYIGGILHILDTTTSQDASNGSLIVQGGVGILENLNVAGNTILYGDLTVNGTTTYVHSTNTLLSDNVLILNAGVAGSKDSGVSIERYQVDNDTGQGDVTSDAIAEQYILPDQTGLNNNEIKLTGSASSVDNYYNNWWIKIASGFNTNQVRQILSYNGTTKIAVLTSSWTSQNPGIGDLVYLYNRNYVGFIFNEFDNRFVLGATAIDPETSGNLSFTTYLPLEISDLYNTGSIIVENTTNATGNTVGGSIITYGGVSIAKDVYIGESLYVSNIDTTPSSDDIIAPLTVTVGNNQASPVNLSNITLTNSIGFDLYLTSVILGTVSNYYTNYHIRGINKNPMWTLAKSYVGDNIDIDILVNTNGNLQYTTPNIPDATSLTFKLKLITI